MIKQIILITFILALQATQAFADRDIFKVGVILPLSGPTSDYGQSMANAIKMAEQDTTNNFNNIQFIIEDSFYNSSTTLKAYKKLVHQDGVNLLYSFGVKACKLIAQFAKRDRVAYVGQCIDQESSRDNPYVFRFMNYTDEYLQVQTDYLVKNNLNNIAVLLSENPYLEEMYQALIRSVHPSQKITLIDTFQPTEFDLRSSISKIKNKEYDTVAVFLFYGQIEQFYRQALEQNLELPSFGTNLFDSPNIAESANGNMHGAVFANNFSNPVFEQRFIQAYPNSGQLGFASLAYEFTKLAGELFNQEKLLKNGVSAEELKGLRVIEEFLKTHGNKGYAAGPYKLVRSEIAGNYYSFPIAIKEIINNHIIQK